MSQLDFPASVQRLARLDPALAAEVRTDFSRLARAGDALAWAQSCLPLLVVAGSSTAVLEVLVAQARQLTGAPHVWALTWSGDLARGRASFRALASSSAQDVPAPAEISSTIVGRVIREGRPAWSDDAASDARFLASQSIAAYALRSVGCLPVGNTGVLYLFDPEEPGRFSLEQRLRLAALCALAGPFLREEEQGPHRAVPEALPGVVGSAPAMAEVAEAVRAFAPMPWPALILGETGTGKEVVARAMHALSPAAEHPFVAVNCGAIPEELAESTLFGHRKGAFTGAVSQRQGLVERVGRGTLFLDEVGELSPRVQVKLLRLLQEGTYEPVGGEEELRFHGRVLAATLRGIDEAGADFREDLYHRLAAAVIRLPPLRERREDIPTLARHLLVRALDELPAELHLELGPAALAELQGRAWPGNVRELENALRGAIARCVATRSTSIQPEHLGVRVVVTAPEDSASTDLATATEAFQRRMVHQALEAAQGNRTRAAEGLGVSRQWLHKLLSRWEEQA